MRPFDLQCRAVVCLGRPRRGRGGDRARIERAQPLHPPACPPGDDATTKIRPEPRQCQAGCEAPTALVAFNPAAAPVVRAVLAARATWASDSIPAAPRVLLLPPIPPFPCAKPSDAGQSWGEDPANPYANRVFQGVYQEAKAGSQTPAASAAK